MQGWTIDFLPPIMNMPQATFTVLVNASPLTEGNLTAYHFCKTLLQKNHTIIRVFFYSDGIYTANSLITSSSDEINLTHLWQELAEQDHIELCVCVSAANRRGIQNLEDAPVNPMTNLAKGFILTGLGQLTEAIIKADRFITFN